MILFINLLTIRLKLLINYTLVLSLVLVPIVFYIISISIDLNKEKNINIGICYDNLNLKNLIEPRITTFSNKNFNIIFYNTKDDLKKSVLTYSIDCGYFIKDGYTKNYANSIEVFVTPTTTSSNIFNIFLSSILMVDRSGDLGYLVLKKYTKIDKKIVSKTILDNSYNYFKNGAFMDINYANSENIKVANNKQIINFGNFFYGIFFVFLMFMNILNIEKNINENKSDIFKRISIIKNGIEKYLVINVISQFFINFLYLSLSSLLINLFYKVSFSFINILIAIVLFSFLISFATSLISFIIKENNYIFIFAFFTLIFSIIFGDIIIPIKNIILALDKIKYLNLSFYYIQLLNSKNNFILIFISLIIILCIFIMLNYYKYLYDNNDK